MIRFPFLVVVALLAAEIVEIGVLPPVRDALPGIMGAFFAWHLLALCAVIAGLFRGETTGMLTALAASLLFGFSTDPNLLGPAILSFGVTAALAGRLARHLRLIRFHNRFVTIFILITIAALLMFLIQKIFNASARLDFPWLGMIVTSLIGAAVFAALAPRFRLDLMEED